MGHFRRLRACDWFEDEGAPGAPFLFLELTLPRVPGEPRCCVRENIGASYARGEEGVMRNGSSCALPLRCAGRWNRDSPHFVMWKRKARAMEMSRSNRRSKRAPFPGRDFFV